MGGESLVWSTQGTVRAALWPVSANEKIRAASPTMTLTHRIRIRYYSGIGPDWRVKFGSRYFSIESIINHEERGVQMDLLCREVVA
jgi:SPP1 family predicted phage head-tail adaptor